MTTLKSILLSCLVFLSIEAHSKSKDLNDCSIGICNYDQILNSGLDQFLVLEEQQKSISDHIESKEIDINEVEIKKTKECKKVAKEQLFHMFYMGDPKDGKEFDDYSNISYNFVYKKYQVLTKDYVIYEIELKGRELTANLFNLNGKEKNYTLAFTLVQKRKSCELVKYVKGTPFNINR